MAFITMKGMCESKGMGNCWTSILPIFVGRISCILEYTKGEYNIVIESSLEEANCLGSNPDLATY